MVEGPQSSDKLTADQKRELLRKLLEKKAREPRQFPLSLGQEALWFLERLDPGRPTYGFYPAVRVRGPLDVPLLERSFAEVIRRHDVFRTTFPEVDGQPVQRVTPASDYRLPVVEMRGLSEAERHRECLRMADDRPPIDIENGPVIRAQVFRFADDDHVVTLHIHHIVFDGWSLGVMARELLTIYSAFRAGQPSPLPPLSVQFADFAAWQRKHLQGDLLSQLQNYWKRQLAGLPPLDMATDFPRPAVRTSRGAVIPLAIPRELTDKVLEFSRREHFTPFMTLLAGFQELLRRQSGQDDFAIGTPTANRRQKSFEPLIGYFINILVLRANVGGDPTFRQLVERVRDTALDAHQHQELTLDKIVEAVQPARDLSRHPLFQVMFVVQNTPQTAINVPGFELTSLGDMESPLTAKFELTVPLWMTERGFEGQISFNTDLFTEATVRRMADHYLMLLDEALDRPNAPLSQLKMMRESERQRVVVEWNQRRLPAGAARTIPERFAAHARRSPDAIAVVDDERSWTYAELDRESNRLARLLRARGVGPEAPVGVCLERSGMLVAALLAIWKAGGAYVPLDPGHAGAADERVRFILDDAQVVVVVTDEAHRDLIPADDSRLVVLEREQASLAALPAESVAPRAHSEQLAYVIYTSGSTGRPKGVLVTHGNLENAYRGWEREYRLDTDIRSHLQMASFGFDVFTGDLARAMGSGGRLVFCHKETMLEPAELAARLRNERIDAAEFVPVVLRNLIQHLHESGQKLDFMRLVAVGSDAWYVEDHERALATLGPGVRLVNSYGLTETTIDSTYFEGDSQSLPPTGIVPIGKAFPNVTLYVLDPWQRPVPEGVAGELYIGGPGVARGYLNRPDLQAERFVVDSFSNQPGARLCRTGDRVRWRRDGQLEFLGRADDQVKIRGFRIEPGEVEEVLREHPELAEAAVVARERQAGDLRLVAYYAPRHGEPPAVAELRRFLGDRLPEYMVPSAFVPLDKMPTTPNGKVDRRSLPAVHWDQALGTSEYVAPRTPTEQRLAAAWTEILGIPRISAHDSFFELGGNSLMAVRLIARVRAEFQVELPLVTLFTTPTLEGLAERIEVMAAQGVRPVTAPIPKAPRAGGAPISTAQELFWGLVQLFPTQPIISIYAAMLINGELDVPTLRRVMNEIVRRHESLRTYFVANELGEPRQFVAPPGDAPLSFADLRELPPAEREAEVKRRAKEQSAAPIPLDKPPLFRLELLRTGDQEHVLLTTVSHIVFDGWSLHVLVRELSELYEAYRGGLPSQLGELTVQYSDYAAWERETLRGPELERLLTYWSTQLAGVVSPPLPFKRHAPPGVRHIRGEIEFELPEGLRARVERFARAHSTTAFNVFLAAFKSLLARYGNFDDITVGVPVANRSRPETQRMIGVFVNTIFLRTSLAGDPTFGEVLERVRKTYAEGTANEALPMPLLVQKLDPNYNPERFPIVQVLFNYLQPGAAPEARRRRELDIEILPSEHGVVSTRHDLSITLAHSDGRINATLKYDSTTIAQEDAERLARHYTELLDQVVERADRRLSEISFLTAEERRLVLDDWNATDVTFELPDSIQALVEVQVAARPEAPAVVFEGQEMSFAAMNDLANQVAHRLREMGVVPGDRVGLCVERSLQLPSIVLGIIKSGGAYVPLDPSYPVERLEFMAIDSEPRVIVTTISLAERLGTASAPRLLIDADEAAIAQQPRTNPVNLTEPEHPIYVIYTSGSTGLPKGAINPHRALLNRMGWERREFNHQPGDRFLLKTSLCFDPSFIEIFRPLCHGGTLVVARPGAERDPDYLADVIERERVGMTTFVPSILRLFLEQENLAKKCASLKTLTCGGEAMTPDLVALFHQKLTARLYNLYGPTETAVSICYYRCEPGDSSPTVPIGRPMSNVRLYILDAGKNLLPPGMPGELYIGGAAVGSGYWNRPELTAERFVPDPFSRRPNATMYRTGDLCRYRVDGAIEFLGRTDAQLKIRGNRVELGEIEACLARHPLVSDAAVVAVGEGEAVALVAHVVPRAASTDSAVGEDSTAMAASLRDHARQFLPDYMTPAEFIVTDALPLMPNGKVNRAALQARSPNARLTVAPTSAEPPRGAIEERLAAIWSETLRWPSIGGIGRNVDFFALGGNSLQAIRVMRRLNSEYSLSLPPTEFFAARTIAELAARIAAAVDTRSEQGEFAVTGETGAASSDSPTIATPAITTSRDTRPATSDTSGSRAPTRVLPSSSPRHRRWLAPLRTKGHAAPLFCIHGLGGHIAGFLPLAKQLREGRPVYGLQGQGLDGATQPHQRLDEMARCYLSEIRELQPEGPYLLAGWSLGGLTALEMARQLAEAGAEVALLAMLDTYMRVSASDVPEMNDATLILRIAPQLRIPLGQLRTLTPQQQWELIAQRAEESVGVGIDEIRRLAETCRAHMTAVARFEPPAFDGRSILFRAESGKMPLDPRWSRICPRLKVERVPGDHYSMLQQPHVQTLAARLDQELAAVEAALAARGEDR